MYSMTRNTEEVAKMSKLKANLVLLWANPLMAPSSRRREPVPQWDAAPWGWRSC